MRKEITILVLFYLVNILCLNLKPLSAGNLSGGEITWQQIGQDSFIFNLSLYRDCNGSQMDSATLNFKCASTGTLITSVSMSAPSGIDITPLCRISCSLCSNPSCNQPYGIQKYIYTSGIINLISAGNCCDIKAFHQSSSRSSKITTGLANNTFYSEAKFNRCLSEPDNSPVFTSDPVTILCVGEDAVLSFNVSDVDLDSFGNPLDSMTFSLVTPRGSNGTPLSYSGQYTYNMPVWFWGFPYNNLPFPRGFHLDTIGGELQFRPMKIEQTVIAVKVSEFRKGILIGETTRDIQIMVINCPSNRSPFLRGPYYYEVCAGDTISFAITTSDYDPYDTLTISINYYVPDSTWSWSSNNDSVKHPTGLLTWIPDASYVQSIPYSFEVTVKDNACPTNATTVKTYQILVKDRSMIDTNIIVIDSGCGRYHFITTIYTYDTLFYLWKVNGGIFSNDSSFYYNFNKPGIYPYSLNLTSANGCTDDTLYDTIVTDTFLGVELPPDTSICYGTFLTISPIIYFPRGDVVYQWSNGDSLQSTVCKPPYWKQDLTLSVMDTTGCVNSDDISLFVKNITVDVGEDIIFCTDDTLSLDTAIIISIYHIDYEDTIAAVEWYKLGDTSVFSFGDTLITSEYGTYFNTVSTTYGCSESDTIVIQEFEPIVIIDSIPATCVNGAYLNMNNYENPFGGTWSSSSSGLDSLNNFIPSEAGVGEHVVYYHFIDPIYGCSNTDTAIISILSLPDTTITKTGDTLNAVSGKHKYEWFKDASPIGNDTNALIVEDSGYYYITITDSNGCTNTSSSHYVYIEPEGIINVLSETPIKVYPNPTKDIVYIQSKQPLSGFINIIIVDLLGTEVEKQVLQTNNSRLNLEIDMGKYSSGIYYIKISSEGSQVTFKLMKN